VMLLGVLRMPIDYVGAPLSPMAQLVARAREAADRIEADAATIATERSSRGMFVARLENMQAQGDKWLTTQAVLALLSDCDMLAAREWPNVEVTGLGRKRSNDD